MQLSCRRLPHHYAMGEPLFVTFRLHGSLPTGRVFASGRLSSGKAFACLDRLLDEQRAGPAYLRMPAIAEVVADAIGQGTASDYLLHAWVVMPNHVHLLITPQVLQNPVRVGLARSAEEYPWSSISRPGGLKPAAG
jgi:putative transposase